MVGTKVAKNIERFNLDRINVELTGKLSSDWWCCKSVYVSDICIVLHLAPSRLPVDDAENSKKDLYRLARRVWATALLSDLVRPVAIVISDKNNSPVPSDYYRMFDQWTSDQGWHRGHFCLYPVPGIKDPANEEQLLFPLEKILQELLSPKPDVIKDVKIVDEEEIINRMESAWNDPKDREELSKYSAKLRQWWEWRQMGQDGTAPAVSPAQWADEISKQAEMMRGDRR